MVSLGLRVGSLCRGVLRDLTATRTPRRQSIARRLDLMVGALWRVALRDMTAIKTLHRQPIVRRYNSMLSVQIVSHDSYGHYCDIILCLKRFETEVCGLAIAQCVRCPREACLRQSFEGDLEDERSTVAA